MPLQKYWRHNASGRQFSPEIVKCVRSMCINQHSIFLHPAETDLILGVTGVTEIELTSVIALDIKHVVSILWRDKEASASTAKIVWMWWKYFWQSVGPFRWIAWSAFIQVNNVSQLVRSRVIPHLQLQASSTWVQIHNSGSGLWQESVRHWGSVSGKKAVF